jgi:hypothetical protein
MRSSAVFSTTHAEHSPPLLCASRPHGSMNHDNPAETRDISAACRCSSRARVDHQPGYHVAAMGTEAARLLVLWMAGWINSRQLEVIDFLREENRVLRKQLGGRRLRFRRTRRSSAASGSADCSTLLPACRMSPIDFWHRTGSSANPLCKARDI